MHSLPLCWSLCLDTAPRAEAQARLRLEAVKRDSHRRRPGSAWLLRGRDAASAGLLGASACLVGIMSTALVAAAGSLAFGPASGLGW